MNLIPPLNAEALLKRYRLHAHKGLGQNFLQDPFALEEIISAAEIQPTGIVLEIGPGLGSLTRYLAVSAQEVVAVELDENLISPLKSVLAPYQNVRTGVRYPPMFLYLSTQDDRVHPGHARKWKALMEANGSPVYYHEYLEGGYSVGADRAEALIGEGAVA